MEGYSRHRLVDLLPQVCSEDLDKGDLEGWNFTVHENTGQIQLDLESNVDVGSVDRWRPPHGESSVRDLGQTGSLGIGELLVPKKGS